MKRRWISWLPASRRAPAVEPVSQDRLTEVADILRDQRRWPEAARAYRVVLSHNPSLAPIWIQLGHALKEAGDSAAAEAAYRQALGIEPRNADGFVQLGHVLKLQDRRDEAIAAYAAALQVNSGFAPALRELINFGAGPVAGTARGHGLADLHDLLRMTRDMREMLDRVERMLPDIVSLATIAIGQYGLFRTLYRIPPPPAMNSACRWGILIVGHDGDIAASLASVARQTLTPKCVWVADASPAALDLARQCGNYGFAGKVESWGPAFAGCDNIDWLLVVADGAVLQPLAVEWMNWAVATCNVSAIYPDEDWEASDTGEPVPNFKAGFDRFADPALYDHAVVAVRAGMVDAHHAIVIANLIAAAADREGAGHLARVLATRPGPPPRPLAPTPTQISPTAGGRISVIIPTKDGLATLRPCVEALQRLAGRPDDLDFVILDNQSAAPDTLTYLTQLAETGRATVVRVDAAFNWSALNNTGAGISRADLLLFVNDDVEVQTFGWDDILRTDLAMPDVGVVGVRLTYPDGMLQHAGLVFGPGGRCEHEGVGVGRILDQIAARWRMRRQVGAVTGAFLACKAADFTEIGCFDPALPIWFNDVDFCLRMRQQGRAILFDPSISALHHESRTLSLGAEDPVRRRIWDWSLAEMQRRWGEAMTVDAGFNPHFARVGRPFEALSEPSLALVAEQLQRAGWSAVNSV